MININLEHLTYFRYACRSKSLRQAAEQAGISPQGFSKAMATLETRVGGDLFEQGADGERTLTEYGQALLRYAESCAAASYELENELNLIRARERRVIRVGGWDFASILDHDFPGSFEAAHDGVTVEYYELADHFVDDSLLTRKIDLGLAVHPYHPELIVRDAIQSRICFFVHASSPLANRDFIEPKDLEGMPMHVPGYGFKTLDMLLDACGREGVRLGPLTLNAIGYGMYEYVSQNRGLGWGLDFHANLPIFQSNPDVRCVPSWMTLRAGIGYLRGHSLTDYELDFIDYFAETVAKVFKSTA